MFNTNYYRNSPLECSLLVLFFRMPFPGGTFPLRLSNRNRASPLFLAISTNLSRASRICARFF